MYIVISMCHLSVCVLLHSFGAQQHTCRYFTVISLTYVARYTESDPILRYRYIN